MKLGFLTAPFPSTPLTEVADWAAANGFESLEIACWPPSSGDARRYAGTSHIDVTDLSATRASEIVSEVGEKGLSISGLGFYPNPLHPDPEHRDRVIGHLRHVIVAAGKMGVPFVNTFMGGDAAKSQDENWVDALEIWPDIVRHAQDNGVQITIENCPMIFSRDEWPGGVNIAWNPYIWRRIIEQWGGTVGLNYDPSHLVWLMIDQARFIREFGPHILHVQAKDVQIDRDGLYERGTMSSGIGWQIPRLPGLGEADWPTIFSALYRAGYDGDIIIEHEDRDFEKILAGTDVAVGTTIGFPHGNHLTATKVFEAERALADGATELDMVIQIGALKAGRDAEVEADIRAVVETAHAGGAIVKVIFENAYLTDDEKVRACRLTEAAGAEFVKTSTGFAPTGATHDDLRLMRANTSPHVQVKAAGGVRTLDALLEVMALGVTRIGATATATIIDDFRARKNGSAAGPATAAPDAGSY